jgi:predicted nucleotidyltransferase
LPSWDIDAVREYHRQRDAQRRARREAERQRWLLRARQVAARLGPDFVGVRRVFLFGSLVNPGRFRQDSDIDVAVECDSVETKSAFWRALERELGRPVDVRPLTGRIADVVVAEGEQVYG